MSELNDSLKKKVSELKLNSDRARAIQKEKYHYCRDMGFNYKEARILQNWNWSKINKLVMERQNEKLKLTDSK